MRRPVLDFRRCSTCGVELPRDADGCASCGRYARGLSDVVLSKRGALGVVAPIVLSMLALLILPLGAGAGAALLGAGLMPITVAAVWLAIRRVGRDVSALGPQIERLDTRIAALRVDLCATERRLADTGRDLAQAKSPRAQRALQREIRQDRRLREAQRRMVGELRAKVERLRIARIRAELAYAEACRDARIEMPELAADVAARIVSLERSLDGSEMEPAAWRRLTEDLRLLHRDLTRGVPRLLAAARLDPLSNAGISDDPEDPSEARDGKDVTLDGAVECHLERISRSFDALDELASDVDEREPVGAAALLRERERARVVRLRVDDASDEEPEDVTATEPRLVCVAAAADS